MKRSVILLSLLVASSAQAEPYAFEMIVVDPNDPHPLGDEVRLKGVNNMGQVVGSIDVDEDDPRVRGFIWSEDNGYQLIGSPESPALNVFPEGVDDNGRIAATVNRDYAQYDFVVSRASTYNTSTGVWSEHHPWGGCSSQMQAMSEGGWFCGELADLDQNGDCGSFFFEGEGFAGDGSSIARVGMLTSGASYAHDVNDLGDAVGEASIAGTFSTQAYYSTFGGMIEPLPGLGGSYWSARGVNYFNVCVGEAWPTGDFYNYAVKWYLEGDWTIKSLDPGTGYSVANDINDLNNIVGWYYNEDVQDRRGVMWVDDVPFELDRMVVNPDPSVVIWDALQISNTNWIIGEGRRSGQRVGIILKPVDQDTDGDGLLDSWERDGIDVDKDGTIDLMLPEGVDPMRKDLLVEIDVMLGAPFYQSGLDDVAAAFADAPVLNPDESTGISAHFIVSDTDLPFAESWNYDFTEFNIITPDFRGNADERADPNWDLILEARQLAYRYCVVVNSLNDGVLGSAERPGNQMMIGIAGHYDNERYFATTFMHELGHNLGLHHGGDDGINYKPNYISCMNYNFDDLKLANGEPVPLDYSREYLPSLDESSIDETAVYDGSPYNDVLTYFGMDDGMGGRKLQWVRLSPSNIDWDGNGIFESGVSADLNWFSNSYPGDMQNASPGEVLLGVNDWDLIEIPIGHFGPFAGLLAQPSDVVEQTNEERDWLEKNLPDPPIVDDQCQADLNDDGELDFFDVSAFLMAYNTMDPAADFNDDEMFNFFDVSLFLGLYNAGCP